MNVEHNLIMLFLKVLKIKQAQDLTLRFHVKISEIIAIEIAHYYTNDTNTISFFNPYFLCHTMKLLELNQFFYLSNRKNICFNKVANCNRQSHFIVLYGAAIWFFIQVIFSSALHFPYVINLVNSILYGTHWYWLALQLLLSAPHQLRSRTTDTQWLNP